MTTHLIISSDKEKREEYALGFCREQGIDVFDITMLKLESEKKASIGIEEVRKLQEKLQLKPFKSSAKAAIIFDSQTLTIEAQNALLKTLEEPPADTYILLTAETEEAFLPTILSRCNVILLETPATELTEQEREVYQRILEVLSSENPGEKLSLAQQYGTKKEDALVWLEKIIRYTRELLLQQPNIPLLTLTSSLSEAHKTIKTTNVNPRLVLEHSFLELS